MIEIGPQNLMAVGRDLALVTPIGTRPLLRCSNPQDAAALFDTVYSLNASGIEFNGEGAFVTWGNRTFKVAGWFPGQGNREGVIDLWHRIWKDHPDERFHDYTWSKEDDADADADADIDDLTKTLLEEGHTPGWPPQDT